MAMMLAGLVVGGLVWLVTHEGDDGESYVSERRARRLGGRVQRDLFDAALETGAVPGDADLETWSAELSWWNPRRLLSAEGFATTGRLLPPLVPAVIWVAGHSPSEAIRTVSTDRDVLVVVALVLGVLLVITVADRHRRRRRVRDGLPPDPRRTLRREVGRLRRARHDETAGYRVVTRIEPRRVVPRRRPPT